MLPRRAQFAEFELESFEVDCERFLAVDHALLAAIIMLALLYMIWMIISYVHELEGGDQAQKMLQTGGGARPEQSDARGIELAPAPSGPGGGWSGGAVPPVPHQLAPSPADQNTQDFGEIERTSAAGLASGLAPAHGAGQPE